MFTNNRRSHRVNLQLPVTVDAGEGAPQHQVLMVDVSEQGARLALENPGELPEDFTILLSYRGFPRRRCHVLWRSSDHVGVGFYA